MCWLCCYRPARPPDLQFPCFWTCQHWFPLLLSKLLSPVQKDEMQGSGSSHSKYPMASTSVWSDLHVNPNFLSFFSLMQPIWAGPIFRSWQFWALWKVSKPCPPLGTSNSWLLIASLTVKLSVLIVIVISLQDSPQHTRLFPDKQEQPSWSHKAVTTEFEEMCRLFSVTNHFPFLSSQFSLIKAFTLRTRIQFMGLFMFSQTAMKIAI